MKLSHKLRIISYLVNLSIYCVVITLYAEIFPNYLKIIPLVINNSVNSNVFMHFLVGYVNFFVSFIIPILLVWIINLIFVIILKRTPANVFIMWLYKNLIFTTQKKDKKLSVNNDAEAKSFHTGRTGELSFIKEETSSESYKLSNENFNYNSIRQGNILMFLQLSVLHFIFWIPFVGWALEILYFIWTIILDKSFIFLSEDQIKPNKKFFKIRKKAKAN